MNHLIGLKVWSSNLTYNEAIYQLFENHQFDYIELFTVPGSFEKSCAEWVGIQRNARIPFIIHAAHYQSGLNMASSDFTQPQRFLIQEAFRFADALKSPYVIFHPGINGTELAAIKKINEFKDERVLIENKPHVALDSGLVCNGSTPEAIAMVLKETQVGFCFDVGHAIYAANALGADRFYFLKTFSRFNPKVIHLSDGDFASIIDSHMHLGEGTFPFEKILPLFPREKVFVTLETGKQSPHNLDDFSKDAQFIRDLMEKL